jgi:hypothetical protein
MGSLRSYKAMERKGKRRSVRKFLGDLIAAIFNAWP